MLIERKEILNEDQSIGYIESIFNSDNVLKTTYFPKAQRLYIAFSRGQTYRYDNFPMDIYNEFEKAESQGKFFHSKIKNNKEFIYYKYFTLCPSEINEIKKIIENKINEDELY